MHMTHARFFKVWRLLKLSGLDPKLIVPIGSVDAQEEVLAVNVDDNPDGQSRVEG